MALLRVARYAALLGGLGASLPAIATPDENWVHAVYADALNRPETTAERAAAIGLLGSNSRTTVADSIITTGGTGAEYFGNFLNAMYNAFLGRSPSTAESTFLTTQFLGGTVTDDNARTSVASSTEFFLLAGNTNGGFVDKLYQDALGRAPDSSTRAGFVTFLNGGGSRLTVATDVVESNEFETNLVNRYYMTYLDRLPDPLGVAYINELLAGAHEEVVQTEMMGSGEYYTNAQAEAVPEPASLTVLAIAGLGLARRRRVRRSLA